MLIRHVRAMSSNKIEHGRAMPSHISIVYTFAKQFLVSGSVFELSESSECVFALSGSLKVLFGQWFV